MVRQNIPQLLRRFAGIILGKEDPGLLLVAHKAVAGAEKVPPLHGDAHVGNRREHGLPIFLRQIEYLFDDLLVAVDLQRDAVGVPEDLVPVFIQRVQNWPQIRALGDGGHHVAAVVKHGQPGSHAVRHGADVIRVDLVILQFADHIRTDAGIVHQTDKGGAQLHIGNVLRQVSADAAMHLLYPSGVPSAGNVYIGRIAFDIHKDSAQNHNAHRIPPDFAETRKIDMNFTKHDIICPAKCPAGQGTASGLSNMIFCSCDVFFGCGRRTLCRDAQKWGLQTAKSP